MDSGFAIDDQYNVYDKGLFRAQNTTSATSTLFKLLGKPDKRFKVVPACQKGQAKVPGIISLLEFDKPSFRLDRLLKEVKGCGRKALDKVWSGGTMRACSKWWWDPPGMFMMVGLVLVSLLFKLTLRLTCSL
ncbi:hypothetical protein MKX03_000828 [Papaver bracteatum]|nr:hypothetical protein MKX03_000828 [Papaver bracteatum]